jgi:hypothetical protein
LLDDLGISTARRAQPVKVIATEAPMAAAAPSAPAPKPTLIKTASE